VCLRVRIRQCAEKRRHRGHRRGGGGHPQGRSTGRVALLRQHRLVSGVQHRSGRGEFRRLRILSGAVALSRGIELVFAEGRRAELGHSPCLSRQRQFHSAYFAGSAGRSRGTACRQGHGPRRTLPAVAADAYLRSRNGERGKRGPADGRSGGAREPGARAGSRPVILAVIGKGGVGKTTVTSLLLRRLVESGETPVLAIDADPSSCLGTALGVAVERTLADMREELRDNNRPPSMSSAEWLALSAEEALVENPGFDLLTMGRPEGKGCYCYRSEEHTSELQSLRHLVCR